MHKVIAVLETAPGQTEEELRRGRLTLEVLRTQPGFLSYEAVRAGEHTVVVVQAWASQAHFRAAMRLALERRANANEADIIVQRSFYAGEVVTSSAETPGG